MNTDMMLRLLVVALFFYWNLVEGAVFENHYPMSFVKLYPSHAWHFLLLSLVVAAAMWCPSVSIMVAMAIFFYVLDFESISLLNSI
jgi:hypothetical protein